jgi:hypothetical protein
MAPQGSAWEREGAQGRERMQGRREGAQGRESMQGRRKGAQGSKASPARPQPPPVNHTEPESPLYLQSPPVTVQISQ